MPFKTIKGLKGKVYIPETDTGCLRKHRCKDCFSCQMCSDDRCKVCRGQKGKAERPLPEKGYEGDINGE